MCNTLSGKKINEDEIMISLDVVSLFTNVPIDLALISINKRWSHINKHTTIPQEEFTQAIEFVLMSTYFVFNNCIYRQVFGTPMGSPLSPIIADLVMQDLEETIFNNIDTKISFYYRYVDDIILTVHSKDIDTIVNSFNNYHDRLKFTVEYESNRCLNFLDLTFKIINNIIFIDWHKKETYSGRVLSYYSNHPLCHKIGIIYNLTDRCLLLSHPQFYNKNMELIINILLSNGYPLDLIFNNINLRIKYLISRDMFSKEHKNKLTQTRVAPTEENRRRFFVVPYIKKITEMIVSSFKKPKYKTNTIVGYRCLNKLNRIIKTHKDVN